MAALRRMNSETNRNDRPMVMKHPLKWLRSRCFRRDRSGVATIEFAMILPILTLLLVGGVELLMFIWAAARVTDASQAVGNLLSKNTIVSEETIGAIFSAADSMIETSRTGDASTQPIDVTLTSAIACECSPGSSDFCFTVLWSHRYQNGEVAAGYEPGTTIDVVPSEAAAVNNDTVIVAESAYRFEPELRFVLPKSLYEIEDLSFYRPRLSERVSHVGDQMLDPEPTCTTLEDAFGDES